MEIGIYSFAEMSADPLTGKTVTPSERLKNLLEEITLADQVGLDVFGLGEHHREDFAVSSPATVLATAAGLTKQIKLTSAATVLATDVPTRLYQQFSTLDLLSDERAEMMVGRGAYVEAFKLFGKDLSGYETLFRDNLNSLLDIRRSHKRSWPEGWSNRAQPKPSGVYPRPSREIPIWYASAGSPQSAVHAGELGLPIAVMIEGGQMSSYSSLFERYRKAGKSRGHFSPGLAISVCCHGFVGIDEAKATEDYFPYYAASINRNRRCRNADDFTMGEFDHAIRPENHLFFGSPQNVAEKILMQYELFGNDRFLMQMSSGAVPHAAVMRSIELLGTKVAPIVRNSIRKELFADPSILVAHAV